MAFYIVVRHPDNPCQPYSNSWAKDNDCLDAITTPGDVARLLKKERNAGNRIYVHRCAWGGAPATICCSLAVGEISEIDKSTCLVRFSNARPLSCEPHVSPHQGQNYYVASPP